MIGVARRDRSAEENLPADPAVGPVGEPTAGRRRRWRGWRRVALLGTAALASAAVVVGAWWLLLGSTVLGVRTVQVQGTHAFTSAQVLHAAAVPTGGPLAKVDTGAAAGRVLRLPGIADVQVSRRFPHTISIRVTERVPIAVLSATGGRTQLLDAAAAVWVPPGPVPPGLPVLMDRDGLLDARSVDTAVQVSTSLPASLHSQVRALVAVSPSAVLLVLRNQRVLVWGGPDDTATKARVAAALLGATKAWYVDVSAPAAPVTRPTVPAGLIPG